MALSTSAADALRQVDLFSGLSKKSLDRLASRIQTVHHAAGKELASEGKGGVAFHMLQSGTAEVLVGSSVVRMLGPGDYFGELSLIDHKPRSATVRTTSEVTAWVLVAWDFAPLLDEPEVAKALLVAMCERLRSAEARRA